MNTWTEMPDDDKEEEASMAAREVDYHMSDKEHESFVDRYISDKNKKHGV